jgi:hypothetical protein
MLALYRARVSPFNSWYRKWPFMTFHNDSNRVRESSLVGRIQPLVRRIRNPLPYLEGFLLRSLRTLHTMVAKDSLNK